MTPSTPITKPAAATSWWHNATTEQRLAQLDGGIELGLTAYQIALATGGVARFTISKFASYHGHPLESFEKHSSAASKGRATAKARNAFLRGERVDFFGIGNASPDEFRLEEVE